MSIEKDLIKQLTPIKFTGEAAFIIPNHSGLTGNTDAVNKLDARYAVANAPTNYRGSDFVGVDPLKQLVHSRTLPPNTMLIINGRIMHRIEEYLISGDTIIMQGVVIDDADYIMVCD